MLRISGINVLGVLLGGISVWLLGFLWYGIAFDRLWRSEMGYTEEMVSAALQPGLFFAGGCLISLSLAFAQAAAMKAFGATDWRSALRLGAWIGVFIGLPMAGFGLVYQIEHSWTLFALHGGYNILLFVLAGLVLAAFWGKDTGAAQAA
ncbi:MAG: DUF1761 domain-containing protein [Henriciella sp.]|jgi:hypothetical protein